MHARGRANTPTGGNGGHRGIERRMRPRVAHGVRMSGAPRRSRSQQPVLDATPPPAPLHRAEALELGNLNRLTYLVVSPGWMWIALRRLVLLSTDCLFFRTTRYSFFLKVRFFYFKDFKVRHSIIVASSKFSITRQGLFQESRKN